MLYATAIYYMQVVIIREFKFSVDVQRYHRVGTTSTSTSIIMIINAISDYRHGEGDY